MAHYKTAGRLAVVGPVASLLGLGLEPTLYSASCGSLRTAQGLVQLCGLASTSPARRHYAPSPGWPTRNGISLPIRRTLPPRRLRCVLTDTSPFRALLAAGTPSHDASKPICHFCLWLVGAQSLAAGALGQERKSLRPICAGSPPLPRGNQLSLGLGLCPIREPSHGRSRDGPNPSQGRSRETCPDSGR